MPIETMPAAVNHEIAWNSGPLQSSPPALFTNINNRVLRPWATLAGTEYELDKNEVATWRAVLDNRDGAFDPGNASSPFWPNVQSYRPCRIRCQSGVNQLSLDQATAGEFSQITGNVTAYSKLGIVNDFGYPITIVTSGSAWQGSQVYQAVLPIGATQYSTVIMVQQLHVIPGKYYTFSAQTQVTTGNSPQCNVGILFYDNNGTELAADGGPSATLTAGAGAWTQLSGSFQAPDGAYSAWAKIELSGAASLTAATTFLIDALQWEQSQTLTPWQMPLSISANLFPREIATGTQSIDPTQDSPANYFYPEVGTVAQATWLPAPASGQTTALAWTSPSGTTSNGHLYVGVANPAAAANGPVQDVTQVTALQPYTVSLYMSRTSSADLTVQVTVGVRWFDQYGNLLSTSAGTAVTVPTNGAWVRGTCSATAPAGAAWGRARIYITTPTSTTASNTVFCAGWQMEQANAASAWTDPGPMPSIFTGFMEQYPQAFELSGTWGRLDAVAVDAMGGLGTDQLYPPFIEEALALGPSFIYQLADPAGAGMLTDTAGNCPPATTGNSPGGVGSLTLGAGISGTNTFVGTQGPVAQFANTPATGTQSPLSYIALPAGVTTPNYGLSNGSAPPATAWTRAIAFCVSAVPAHPMYLWSATMDALFSGNPCEISFFIDTSGHLNITVTGSVTSTQTYSSTSYADGNWHLATVGVAADGNPALYSVDGVTTAGTATNVNPLNMSRDTIGARVQDPQPAFIGGANAQIALAIQWPAKLTSAQIANLYNSWRSASSGESSGARFQRVLNWIGWTGPTAIDAGSTQSMGPASDLAGSAAVSGLASIATTENGDAFCSSDGKITFKGRSARYNANSPVFIFGEHAQWGEWPYEDAVFPTDPIHTYNDIQVSQYQGYSQYSFYTQSQQTAYAASPSSQQQFYDRVLARTLNVTSFAEAMSAAAYLLGRYQTPTMRAKTIKLNVSAVPGLFNVALQLGKGSRIRVMKRPPYRNPNDPIQFDGFVERIAWSYDPRGPRVTCVLECSPATRSQYWSAGAVWTTLNAQAPSGQNQATVNALPDSAVNALASSLPAGYQLTFDAGTQFAETMTIAPNGIPTTTPGYSTATLTFTSAFQFTHQANSVATEPLPAGYSDPTSWNANSMLGAGHATFLAAASGGVGLTQIEVGGWSDASSNLLNSDLNTGDLLWLSPGTPQFEGYNLLHPNVSTAGEGVLPLAAGTDGSKVGLSAGYGGGLTVTASGSAWQGANVWQASVGASVTAGSRLIRVLKAAVTPLLAFSWSVYVRSATTGATPSVHPEIQWLDSSGNVISTVTGATLALAAGGPSGAWTRLTLSGTAPSTAMWACPSVRLDSATPASAWSFQADGLQWEQANAASAYQTCPQVLSIEPVGLLTVNGSQAGGTYITLAQPLVNNHAVGDYVCDPLPPGTTTPLAAAGSARLAY